MTKAAATTTKQPAKTSPSVMGTIFMDVLDTGWRIATPIMLLVIPGLIADRKIGSAPWLTLAGLVFGLIGAGLLIKQQLAAVDRRDNEYNREQS